jgi:hypothetical protein
MFAINSLDNFPTDFVVRGINTRDKHQLYRTTVNLSCIQKGVYYSSIKIFDSLSPPSPLCFEIKTGEAKISDIIKRVSLAHTFYSLNEFLSIIQIPSVLNINSVTNKNNN